MQAFEGERTLPKPVPEVWSKLRDARFLVSCIPDSTPGAVAELDKASAKVRPGFSFVRGSMEITIQVTQHEQDKSLQYLLTSKGIGTSSDVEANVTFEAKGNETILKWKAEIKSLGGLLKAIPGGLIRGAAQKVIEDLWTGVAQKIT